MGQTSIKAIALAVLASSVTLASAQACIPLAGTELCPAFASASISTNKNLTDLYSFLSFVSTREQFDRRLQEYITTEFVRIKYQDNFGCSNVTLTNTTNYYSRYTTSVICNGIVQNSIEPCGLSNNPPKPLCVATCATHATDEYLITANEDVCGTPGPNRYEQVRADFANCAIPANALTGSCIYGDQNEPIDCGYSNNTLGLCNFCAQSTLNATDSCCVNSNVEGRCAGLDLPSISIPPMNFPSATATPSTTASAVPATGGSMLTPGAIAGIVIGSIVALALLIGLIIFCCMRRRRRGSQHGSILNQPSPRHIATGMSNAPRDAPVVPGGRVARMTALEGSSSDDRAAGRTGYAEASDTDPYGDSPESRHGTGAVLAGRRNGSLSSNSVFGALGDETSPNSNSNQFSSPEGAMGHRQSEQLPFFKDYYSQDEIHPGDKVATLWAYQPRAGDEFELERGDMLRVVGIWDDGWATGVRIDDRAEDWDVKHKIQRDSGVSNGGKREPSPTPMGDVKAFPLVCVCLPEHWRKTVEGDSSETTSSGGPPAGFSGF